MNRPKKIISFLLAVLMAVSNVPMGAFAFEMEQVGEEHIHEEIVKESEILAEEGEELTHAVPESEGVANAIKRACSLTDIEWTPLADVSGVQKIDGVFENVFFKAGETYKGIPYSGVIPTDTYVGLNVSLESFVTALENKNSVLYTENLHSSSYPKASAYFGTVCSKLVQYALNVPGSFNTNNIANIPGMETIALPGEYTVDDIKLGDVVLHTKDHTTICTDILYDSEGNVAFVEISEAVLPLCRRLLWSPEEFYEHFEGYRLCRYRYIDEVPAPSEFDAEEEHALMPRFGNKYNYKVSSSKGIVDILKKGYSKAVVLRDGIVIDEITIDDSIEIISFDRSVPGKIEMYLEKADGTKSGSVFAMVVKSSVEVTDSASFLGKKLTVSYSGTSGKPLYVQLGSGQNVFIKVESDELSGEEVIKINNPSAVSSYKARIAFENEYGIYLSSYSEFQVDLTGGTGPNPSSDPILSKAVYWDGYNITPSSHVPVIQENKVGYWSYTEIPVESNTEYYSKGATRLWYLDADKEPISTYNAYKESEVPCTFTTPGNCEYVSIAYSSSIVEQGTENIQLLSSSSSFSTTSEAALYLRSQMIAREPSITLRVSKSLSSSEVSAILTKAWEHTGVPNEGDYIRHNQIGYEYTTTAGEDENGAYTEITYNFNWLTTAEQEAEVDAKVDEILAELDLWEKTDYEKIKGAYDWVTENVQYDFDNEDNDEYELCHSTYAAAVLNLAVCQGYATLYYRLMLELGIDCRYIRGMAGYVEPESHAWNIVRLEDKYYNMDPTWDRDLMGHYRMFLCTEANFTEHHRADEYLTEEFTSKYPMAVVPYVFNVTASGKLSNGIEWVLDGDTGTLTVAGSGAIPSYRYSYAPWYQYRESVRSIVISEGITEVGERAFYWSTNCTSLTLPESLVAIREYGFNNLRALEAVTLPSKLKTIEFCAFSECVALKNIVIPDSVTNCGSSAFSNCYGLLTAVIGKGLTKIPDSMFFGDRSLWKVTFPEGLTYIGSTAFGDCGITYLTLPKTLTGMGTSAFAGCYKLVEINVEAGNPVYKSVSGVLFSADGKTLIAYPGYSYRSSYTIPSGTVTVARSAFNDADNLSYVYFPSSLKTIEPYAFAYCSNLSQITFPSNITRIGDSAFRACKLLWKITFENDSVVLESAVFADCDHIHNITLPAKLTAIPSSLFYDCANLQSITIPSTVTKIGSSAFLDCDSLTSVTIPGTVKTIEQQAFDYCDKLETVTMQEGVQKIGWLAFSRNPKLKKVVIPSSVTTIENKGSTDRTFDECPNVVLYVNCGTAGWNYAGNYGIARSTSHPYTQQTVVPPTCTAQGYTKHHCKCGAAAYTSNYTSALGHNLSEESVTPPTCTEQGYTTIVCTRCGYRYNANYTAALGHSTVLENYVAPTCTEPGYSGDEVCETCGTTYYGEVIPATGHLYDSFVTPPTCTEQGYTEYICLACGDSYVDSYTEATGHDYVFGVCTKCGKSKKPYQRITYFTVDVEAENGKTYSDNAVLYLPANYSVSGEPVKLVIYCKQGSSTITGSSNPIEAVGFYNYLINLGYAVLGIDGMPDEWCSELGLVDTIVVGNPLSVQGAEKAYDYIIENYNIASDGCFISGYSQGGFGAQNIIDFTDIPILAAAEQAPACSVRYHQWDLNSSVTVNGVSFTKGARLNVARIYGFPAVSTNAELLNLEYNEELVNAYDPWVRNAENVFTGFVQKGNLWYLPEGTDVDDITMTKTAKCPVKIWCAEDDTAVSADVMKVFVKAIQNGGGIAEISVAKSGGHGFFQNQTAVGTFVENGKNYKTLPIAVEIAEWFERFGGYSCGHSFVLKNYSAPTCTEPGYSGDEVCETCGATTYGEEIPATGHTISDWETVTEPTPTEPGEEQRRCENCDYFESREIPAKGYSLGDVNLDGSVDVMDAYYARLVAAKLIKPTEQQLALGDVDGDLKITAIDANIIRKFVVKILDSFPVEW